MVLFTVAHIGDRRIWICSMVRYASVMYTYAICGIALSSHYSISRGIGTYYFVLQSTLYQSTIPYISPAMALRTSLPLAYTRPIPCYVPALSHICIVLCKGHMHYIQ